MNKNNTEEAYEDLKLQQFKLANGEDIVGFVIAESEYAFIVEMPHLLDITDGVIRMRPWFEMSDQTLFKIENRNVVQNVELVPSYKEYFLSVIIDGNVAEDHHAAIDDDEDWAEQEIDEIELAQAMAKPRIVH